MFGISCLTLFTVLDSKIAKSYRHTMHIRNLGNLVYSFSRHLVLRTFLLFGFQVFILYLVCLLMSLKVRVQLVSLSQVSPYRPSDPKSSQTIP